MAALTSADPETERRKIQQMLAGEGPAREFVAHLVGQNKMVRKIDTK
jgi:hypothetical protein